MVPTSLATGLVAFSHQQSQPPSAINGSPNTTTVAMGETTPFQKEAWAEYSFGACLLFSRYLVRWWAVGFKRWEGDDFFAILALIFWTVSVACGGEDCHINYQEHVLTVPLG